MEPQETDAPEVLETPEGEAPKEEETISLTKAEADELRRKASERDELESKNKQLFERAKVAEGKAKEKVDGLTVEDVLALQGVHEDDLSTIKEWADFKKVSLAEAKKSPTVKQMLALNAEERRTAEATQTRGGARGGSKVSGEDLLAKAERGGDLPDSDEGMAALVAARQARLTRKQH